MGISLVFKGYFKGDLAFLTLARTREILPISLGLSVNHIRGIPRQPIFPKMRFQNLIFSPKDSRLNDDMILILVIRL
jgi:hypothetical protein